MKNRRLGMWLVVMNIPLWGTGFAMRAGERLESNAMEAGMDAYRSGDATLAFERFKEACIGGDATGCVNLGHMIEHGQGTDTEPQWASRFYREACELGNATGCERVAMDHASDVPNENVDSSDKAIQQAQAHQHALTWGVSAASGLLDWEQGKRMDVLGR